MQSLAELLVDSSAFFRKLIRWRAIGKSVEASVLQKTFEKSTKRASDGHSTSVYPPSESGTPAFDF